MPPIKCRIFAKLGNKFVLSKGLCYKSCWLHFIFLCSIFSSMFPFTMTTSSNTPCNIERTVISTSFSPSTPFIWLSHPEITVPTIYRPKATTENKLSTPQFFSRNFLANLSQQLFCGLPSSEINTLQRLQNSAARLITSTKNQNILLQSLSICTGSL